MAKQMFKNFFGVSDEHDDEIYEEYEEGEEEYLEQQADSDLQVALDILDTDAEMILLAPLAGVSMDDIDVSFQNQILTIRGERRKPAIYSESVVVKNRECYWGRFARNVILPENLDFDGIQASMDNNLLMIKIPKLHFYSQNIKIERFNTTL